MRNATETREDDNGGAVDIRYNGDGRKGWRWRRVLDDCGSEYVGHQVQRKQRYRKMDTAA